jgi:threonine/homoserine/homoserine lactone efflux protein
MHVSTIFFTAFLVGFSGAMMPGPLLTATIASSARRGFWAGPLIVLGHAILELILVLALLAGFSHFLTISAVTRTIAFIGGGFLIFLGFSMCRDSSAAGESFLAGDPHQSRLLHPFGAGIFISLSNPYWLIWWATIGLTYLTVAWQKGAMGITCFFSGHILADLTWYSLIALIIAGGRNFLTPAIYRRLIAICGLFLVGLGGYFIYTGFVPKM